MVECISFELSYSLSIKEFCMFAYSKLGMQYKILVCEWQNAVALAELHKL